MILIVSLAVPNRFLYQMIPGAALASEALFHLWVREGVPIAESIGLWSALVVTTAVGGTAAWQLNVNERELFQAQKEIRTLSGVLPICAECKSVRDESGEWSRLERYLTRHSDASFSHGLCPPCLRRAEEELDREDGSGSGF